MKQCQSKELIVIPAFSQFIVNSNMIVITIIYQNYNRQIQNWGNSQTVSKLSKESTALVLASLSLRFMLRRNLVLHSVIRIVVAKINITLNCNILHNYFWWCNVTKIFSQVTFPKESYTQNAKCHKILANKSCSTAHLIVKLSAMLDVVLNAGTSWTSTNNFTTSYSSASSLQIHHY